jgi:hypothetical protein
VDTDVETAVYLIELIVADARSSVRYSRHRCVTMGTTGAEVEDGSFLGWDVAEATVEPVVVVPADSVEGDFFHVRNGSEGAGAEG